MSGSAELWSSFAHDPRDPSTASLRASDGDRDVVHGVLADAFADGRLDRAEYDERSAAVLSARTLGELPPLVTDLVPERPVVPRHSLTAATPADIQRQAEERWLEHRRHALLGFLGPSLICWAIWFAVNWNQQDGGPQLDAFPWPLIVMAATLVNLLRTVVTRREIVAEEVRRLEKKRAKELKAREAHGTDGGPHA